MNRKSIKALLISATLTLCMGFGACYDEPDKSNLYTFTGETVSDFLYNRTEQFSNFCYILERSGYDRLMSAYGSYTCFAPLNDAIIEYIDSLWNDTENEMFVHNGLTENSLQGLTDSLCKDIARFHLCDDAIESMDMSGDGISIPTMLGRTIMTSVAHNGNTLLNEKAEVVNDNNEVVNGIVHVVNHVIPRSNRLVPSELEKNEKFSIFHNALVRTGLADSLLKIERNIVYPAPPVVSGYYSPTTCKEGYTVFAESDKVLYEKSNGKITDFNSLADYAKTVYGNCKDWYDYCRNNGITVSTGTDYTNRFNVVNMFIAYHILEYGIPKDRLVAEHSVVVNKYGYNGDVYDYYETMLPKTLMKLWKVYAEGKIFINRYQTHNTLTDGVETMGSKGFHEVMNEGVIIQVDSVMQPLNGYIYPLDDILVYDEDVPRKVLNERMRFDALTLLPEIMSNNFRGMSAATVQGLNGGVAAARIRFPYNYFNNVKVYNGNNTTLDMNIRADLNAGNAFLLYQGDSFQGMGQYDLAIKLPPVPDGLYEFRVDVSLMKHGSMLQFYLGTSSDRSSMEAIDIPIDMRMDADDPRAGYTDPRTEDDRGLATDKALRNRYFMRGPLSLSKQNQDFNSRYHSYQLRRILLKRDFKQQDYWLRMKTVLPDVSNGKYQLDFVEFVPVSISENEQYLEDMY